MNSISRPTSGVLSRILGSCAREIRHRPVSTLLAVYACIALTVIAVLLANGVRRIPEEPFAVQGWHGWPDFSGPDMDGKPEPVTVEIVGEPAVRLSKW